MIMLIKSIDSYSSTKGTLREDVCLRLIKPTTQVYLNNVTLNTAPHVWHYCPNTCTTGRNAQHYLGA
jgi:hypothetical protein